MKPFIVTILASFAFASVLRSAEPKKAKAAPVAQTAIVVESLLDERKKMTEPKVVKSDPSLKEMEDPFLSFCQKSVFAWGKSGAKLTVTGMKMRGKFNGFVAFSNKKGLQTKFVFVSRGKEFNVIFPDPTTVPWKELELFEGMTKGAWVPYRVAPDPSKLLAGTDGAYFAVNKEKEYDALCLPVPSGQSYYVIRAVAAE